MNKKAQGLSTNTIILIILGIVVLVVLILGFTVGWAGLKDWIAPSNNVQSLVDKCSIACNTDQKFSYCFEKKDLKSDDENIKETTCYILASQKPIYGIGTCPAIDCEIFKTESEALNNCFREDEEVFYLEGLKVVSYTCEFDDLNLVEEPEEGSEE